MLLETTDISQWNAVLQMNAEMTFDCEKVVDFYQNISWTLFNKLRLIKESCQSHQRL